MNNNEHWVIAGKSNDAQPKVGKVYEIRDRRKGTFTGRIISIGHPFATVEVLEGEIHWVSNENRMFNANPKTVGIRCSLCYLIELDQ
jgi:hypothetical protein